MTDLAIRTSSYLSTGDQFAVLVECHQSRVPVMLVGPTGSGKTQLVEYIAEELGRPLVTVTCHDDLTTADLVGRHLIRGGDVEWMDGPLTTAMRTGAICYLDEIIEARADTLAMLHSVADHRRTLFIDRLDEEVRAADEFMLIASYNPREPGFAKELKSSLRQRFATVGIDYLPPELETRVVAEKSGLSETDAARLVRCATAIRNIAPTGNQRPIDKPSTRGLLLAAGLIVSGRPFESAVELCVLAPLTTDPITLAALRDVAAAVG